MATRDPLSNVGTIAGSGGSEMHRKYAQASKEHSAIKELLQAAAEDNLKNFKKCLSSYKSKYPDLDDHDVLAETRDANGRTCVHFAAIKGNLEILHYCTSIGKDLINGRDKEGNTSLHFAGIGEDLSSLSYLLENGCDVDGVNFKGTSCLHIVAEKGNVDAIDLLITWKASLSLGSEEGGSPLHWAAGSGQIDAVRKLLGCGADPNVKDEKGVSPLIMACAAGYPKTASVIVEAGGDPSTIVQNGYNVLHICCEMGYVDPTKSILERHPDLVNVTTEDESSPLDLALTSGCAEVIQILKDAGANMSSSKSKIGIKCEEARPVEDLDTEEEDFEAFFAAQISKTGSEEETSRALDMKQEGNKHFAEKNYLDASKCYSEAISVVGNKETFWCNRAACYIEIGRIREAIRDARVAVRLKPDWIKAHYRLSKAFMSAKRFEDAAMAAFDGLKLDNESHVMKSLLREAVSKGKEEHMERKAAFENSSP